MQPFLPVLPLIIKFPFLRISGVFLQSEYGDFNRIFEAADKGRALELEAVERGKDAVRSIILEKELETPDLKYGDFVCEGCEDKICLKRCPKQTDFFDESCDFCGECFKNCKDRIGEEYYREMVNNAKIAAISYLYSRILMSNLEDWVVRRYAIRESRRCSSLLKDEGAGVLKLLSSDLGINCIFNRRIMVHISSYLRVAVRVRAENWRLLNRQISRGYVFLEKDDFKRIIEEFLREKLSEKVLRHGEPEILESSNYKFNRLSEDLAELMEMAEKVRSKLTRVKIGEIEALCFPPCMKRLLSDLQAGVNLPHTARFALTSFLINIGMDTNEIMSLYRMAPDFDEEKTKYQVEHIAGAKGTEYDAPSCETMKTYHNCFADSSCKGTYHPISFYQRCLQRLKGRKVKE
jgi:DNA primase large subunit